MTTPLLAHLYAHNNWANARLVAAYAALSAEQLATAPDPLTPWSVERVLAHFAEAQQGYLNLLTLPAEERTQISLRAEEVAASLEHTGAALLELARDFDAQTNTERIQTEEGYAFERWVVLVQVINHATDHRRQATRMLRALGVEPPRLDSWAFGEDSGALQTPAGEL